MKIAIIGCGTMGNGLAQRLSSRHSLFFYDRHYEKTAHLQEEGYGKACRELQEAIQQSDIVILAIKPQSLNDSAGHIRRALSDQMVISLLAGTSLARLKDLFPSERIIRMMPNLALVCGEGLIGLAADDEPTTNEKELLLNLCEPLGKIYWLAEEKINAFTALASSGPAFVCVIIESIVDAGIGLGFNAKDAQELVYQMLKGSLCLLKESKKHPGELKWQIASPGGTTIAGLKKLEELAVRGGIMSPFFAAYERANELS